MGGNVIIDGIGADKIDIRKLDHAELVADLNRFIESFEKTHQVKLHPSGSTSFLFEKNGIDLEVFKPVFGDIDLQIDENKMPELLPLATHGQFKLIGTSKTTNTVVTLWNYKGLRIQIDFEGVEFVGDNPTEWSQFAYSSSWTDQLVQIKGVAHKLIFRALTARWLDEYKVRKRGGVKTVITSPWAFSNKGLRKKLIPTDDGSWIELKTSESEYIRDLERIFHILIAPDSEYTPLMRHSMHSFMGVLELIKRYIDPREHIAIADGMANLLWGNGAQWIYSYAWEDQMCKQCIMLNLSSRLNIGMRRWDQMIEEYYGAFQDD